MLRAISLPEPWSGQDMDRNQAVTALSCKRALQNFSGHGRLAPNPI
jgi:hypothetical protein